MAQQRRNRRNPRAINDHALVALHKYYLRAEYMRGLASAARDQLVAKYGFEALQANGPRRLERFHLEMYIDYWYAGIFAVMEGYEKLALTIPEVEALCENPLYTRLRDYRAGVYHFREKYFDDAIRDLLADPTSGKWLTDLDMALGRFLLDELRKRREARERANPPTDDEFR
jgi:hypothetical protein